jgi:hypothetical protein
MKNFMTFFGFVVSAALLFLSFCMLCLMNMLYNGYNDECGGSTWERIWRNGVPGACAPESDMRASF